jgi:hypothetical protein
MIKNVKHPRDIKKLILKECEKWQLLMAEFHQEKKGC